MPSFGNFLHTQLILKIPIPTTSFDFKTVIVTGGNTGLGKEAVKHIVRLGASKVIIGCRNTEKGSKAKHEIESSLRCSPDIIEVWEVDIESPDSVKAFVDKANKLVRLDILINNAGIQTLDFQVVYGTERSVAVNVVGTFLLALQLVPKLKETAKFYGVTPHMTFVGSALYDVAKYPEKHGDDIFAWLSDKTHSDAMNQYNLSKLLLLYAIIKLASLVGPDDKSHDANALIVNSLDPCFCKTGLPGNPTGAIGVFLRVFEFLFARPAEEGSRLVVNAALAGSETHGKYMRAGAVQDYAPFVTSADGVRKSDHVFEKLGERLESLQPGILSNLKIA